MKPKINEKKKFMKNTPQDGWMTNMRDLSYGEILHKL